MANTVIEHAGACAEMVETFGTCQHVGTPGQHNQAAFAIGWQYDAQVFAPREAKPLETDVLPTCCGRCDLDDLTALRLPFYQ
jgi:hypothetical protein